MPQPLHITTPFPSVEETAERAGVPPARTKELLELAQGIIHGSGKASGRLVKHKTAKTPVKDLGRKKRK